MTVLFQHLHSYIGQWVALMEKKKKNFPFTKTTLLAAHTTRSENSKTSMLGLSCKCNAPLENVGKEKTPM